MPDQIDLAQLEALHAAASKTGFQIEGDDLRDAHIGQWLEAAHKTFPALSAELKALRARVGELEADRNEVAQKWLNKEAEVNELLPIKAERDQLREELAAAKSDAVMPWVDVAAEVRRQLTATNATIAGLREALHECVLFLDKIHRFKLIANYSPDYSELQTHRFAAADALTRTPEQHRAAIEARVLRMVARRIREGPALNAAYHAGSLESEADRIEKEAQG